MNSEQRSLSGQRLRQVVFYRFQAFSSFVLCIAIGLSICAIYALIQSAEARLSLSVLLLILGVVIAACQFFAVSFIFSVALNPIEQLFSSLQGWSGEVAQNDAEKISVGKIRFALQNLISTSASYKKKLPKEVDFLQNTFIQTLKLLESAWQKVEADAISVGLGSVCAQVAHDMRSPATSIRVLSKAILDVETPAERKELSDMMGSSAEKLNRMADELLSYRKSGVVELKPIDLSNIIRDTCRELRVLAHTKMVELRCTIPSNLDFLGDADKMSRVIQNLVGNAIQAVERRGSGQVEVNLVHSENQVVLNISDNGPGIPGEYVDKMFQSGFTTKGKQGNGLGLIYCANVVKGHGGHISARNKPEGGAEFRIELPVQVAH